MHYKQQPTALRGRASPTGAFQDPCSHCIFAPNQSPVAGTSSPCSGFSRGRSRCGRRSVCLWVHLQHPKLYKGGQITLFWTYHDCVREVTRWDEKSAGDALCVKSRLFAERGLWDNILSYLMVCLPICPLLSLLSPVSLAMYWVGQKVCSGFVEAESPNTLFANPVSWLKCYLYASPSLSL